MPEGLAGAGGSGNGESTGIVGIWAGVGWVVENGSMDSDYCFHGKIDLKLRARKALTKLQTCKLENNRSLAGVEIVG